jgi:hypothetical protein
MGREAEIREALAEHAGRFGPMQTMLATVQSVDVDALTCVLVDDDELTYEDVRLRPVLDGKRSLTIFPKIDTWALAVRIEEGNDWMVIAVGEADKYSIVKDDDSLKEVLQLIIEGVIQIVVVEGNNPDYTKLQTALRKLNNLM